MSTVGAAAAVLVASPVLVSALAGAAGAGLLIASPPRPPAVPTRVGRLAVPLLLGAGTAAAALAGLPTTAVALVGVLAVAAWAGSGLVARRRRRRETAVTAGRVRETCEALAADLESGRPTGSALERACEAWPPLRPVAAAHVVGAEVPTALRALATEPGCGDLRLVAAAWEVAHRTGHGLAPAVTRVADGLRATETTRRVVASELASARSTARLLAALPVAALLMGTGAGGSPWHFLLATPLGLACLTGGLTLGLAGLWWIEAIADDVEVGT